ncbi:hypothetical protein DL771_000075 [Monosporascus sp. 5C6A]|nr:hypothetical protein DL771_000075 [Monosporascus sp. 5C6A]
MTATAAATPAHDPSASDVFDPDEVLPRNSPLMKPYRPRLQPSPSPPPAFTRPKVSLSPSYGPKSSNRRRKVRPSQGDAVLIHYLDGGKRPDIATEALMHPLARYDEDYDDQSKSDSDVEEEESTTDSGDEEDIRSHEMSPEPLPHHTEPVAAARPIDLQSLASNALAAAPAGPATAAKPVDLQSLATNALAAVTAATHPTDGDDRRLPDGEPRIAPKAKPPDGLTIDGARDGVIGVKDGARSVLAPPMSPYSRHGSLDVYSPRHHAPGQVLMHPSDVRASPTALSPTRPGELPPIQSASPRSETSSHDPLPSIDHLLDQISPSQQEMTMRRGSHFPHSPPSGMLRMSGMPGSHASPPISPNDPYRQGMPSPANSIPVLSPYYFSSASSTSNHRSGLDYSSNGETPNTDPASTPGTHDSINRMSIDSMTNPPMGAFVCKFQGCTAPPFSTQYLLNSHANVHSSARPHYCPVKGCPRSEGGKGFKRKNEMIRHGLVHDSPGYVCPFCPDREHKYPRPDNLQRHVRVHHVDKDKDDPMLREVLAQRPDGPNRGRRRRTGP